MLLVSIGIQEAFGVNPTYDYHRDLKLAPDGVRMTIASGLRLAKIRLLLIRKKAPLEALAPLSGAKL